MSFSTELYPHFSYPSTALALCCSHFDSIGQFEGSSHHEE